MMMHVRNHCSFVQLGVSRQGLLWSGTSSIDHLKMRIRLDADWFESFYITETNSETKSEPPTLVDHIELNMFQLYRIIKRASSFRYERIRLSVASATPQVVHSSPGTCSSATRSYRFLVIRFETQNKYDVYHMRCPQPEHLEGLLVDDLTKCSTIWPHPCHSASDCTTCSWCTLPISQLYDALQRFDHDTFHSIRIRQHSRTQSISLCPLRNHTLTLRSKTDSMSGKVHLGAVCLSPTSDGVHSAVSSTASYKGHYTLASISQTVRFAMLSGTDDIRIGLQPINDHDNNNDNNNGNHNDTSSPLTILHICFDWEAGTTVGGGAVHGGASRWVHVCFPPVSTVYPSAAWMSSSSGSSGDEGVF